MTYNGIKKNFTEQFRFCKTFMWTSNLNLWQNFWKIVIKKQPNYAQVFGNLFAESQTSEKINENLRKNIFLKKVSLDTSNALSITLPIFFRIFQISRNPKTVTKGEVFWRSVFSLSVDKPAQSFHAKSLGTFRLKPQKYEKFH